MAPTTRCAHSGEVVVAYEVFGDPAVGEPLLLFMGLGMGRNLPEELWNDVVDRIARLASTV
jgi:hypothetical protein